VISWGVIDLRPALHQVDDALQKEGVRVVPVPTLPQPPAIDEVADKIQVLRLMIPQKSEETVGVREFAPQMHVAHED
jgi:hypothetical protein